MEQSPFMQFTLKSSLVFIYILPLLSLLIILNNTRLLTIWSMIPIAVNIVSCVVKASHGMVDRTQIQDFAIQIVCVVMATSVAIIVTKMSDKLNQEQIEQIEVKEKEQNELVETIKEVVGSAQQESGKISKDVEELKNSIKDTILIMTQVSDGSSAIAESVQNQRTVSMDIVGGIASIVKCVENTNLTLKMLIKQLVLVKQLQMN